MKPGFLLPLVQDFCFVSKGAEGSGLESKGDPGKGLTKVVDK